MPAYMLIDWANQEYQVFSTRAEANNALGEIDIQHGYTADVVAHNEVVEICIDDGVATCSRVPINLGLRMV